MLSSGLEEAHPPKPFDDPHPEISDNQCTGY